MKIFLASILVIAFTTSSAQKVEYTFSMPGDSTKNYYIAIHPQGTPKGVIILLPGFGELPAATLKETHIPKAASKAGYLTIIPALGDWSFFYIDDQSHQKLNHFILEMFKKYSLQEKSFFMGGHSFGGTMALQYAQHAYAKDSKLKKPAGIFAVDPPLDIERLYGCMTSTNRPPKNPISTQEDNYVSARIQYEFGTNPNTDPKFFWNVSPYAQSDPNHTSLKNIISLPVRIYNEPDIDWYIANRNIDYYCMNALDSAAMINWLKNLGNKRAEIITTSGKGFRNEKRVRHPHSWSIADSTELVNWIARIDEQ